MYRLHPSWQKVREIVASGRIGRLSAVQSWFGYYNDDPAQHSQHRRGRGGALYDVGCYCVNLSRMLFDGEPHRVVGSVVRDPEPGRRRADQRDARVRHGRGHVHVLDADGDRPARPHLRHTRAHLDRHPVQHPTRSTDRDLRDFGRQPAGRAGHGDDHVRAGRSVHGAGRDLHSRRLDGTPMPFPSSDAVANMRVIDLLFESGAQD